jgi:hypothetical protein
MTGSFDVFAQNGSCRTYTYVRTWSCLEPGEVWCVQRFGHTLVSSSWAKYSGEPNRRPCVLERGRAGKEPGMHSSRQDIRGNLAVFAGGAALNGPGPWLREALSPVPFLLPPFVILRGAEMRPCVASASPFVFSPTTRRGHPRACGNVRKEVRDRVRQVGAAAGKVRHCIEACSRA